MTRKITELELSRKCVVCLKHFLAVKPSGAVYHKKRTCSQQCAGVLRNRNRSKQTVKDFKRLLSISRQGENNPNWAGTDVKSPALHEWVRSHLQPSAVCENCKQRRSVDLANVSPSYNPETYNRDPMNWRWLCRRCHMESDGRLDRFIKRKVRYEP
jgi:hypothetical protein